jgi:hypothetical protein
MKHLIKHGWKGQSNMKNPEKRATLDTRHRIKTNKTKTENRKLKRWATRTPPKYHSQSVSTACVL